MNGEAQTGITADFSSYSRAAARRFLRTAVLIDDDIQVAPAEIPASAEPLVAPPFAGGAGAEERAPDASAKEGEPREDSHSPEVEEHSEVSLKPLADAFLDRHIVCGVLKPTMSDEAETVINRAVASAVEADIFIIDWYLRQGDAQMAMEILARVLENDRKLNGRLRLVIIYTSADALEERCEELKDFLEGRGFSIEVFPGSMPCMTINACRIRFVPKSFGASGLAVDALPDFVISEFTDQAKGLMPAFALTGISALREATHHLLATFNARLDPAFVGHRMLLQQPEDSQEFALNVLLLQIRGILSLPHLLGSSLDETEIAAWFDDRFAAEDLADSLKKLNVTKEDLREVVINGDAKGNSNGLHSALFLPCGDRRPQDLEAEVSADFARLTTFVREFKGFNQLPPNWLPTLTLGTVLRLREGGTPRYFLSVQPLCDTVRIDVARFFQFAELKPRDDQRSDFWLIVRESEERLQLRIDQRPGSRYYDEFSPQQGGVIRASKTEGGTFVFKSERAKEYEWIGDIDRAKAQKAANDLSAVLARVGLDEYEWLRRGARAR